MKIEFKVQALVVMTVDFKNSLGLKRVNPQTLGEKHVRFFLLFITKHMTAIYI